MSGERGIRYYSMLSLKDPSTGGNHDVFRGKVKTLEDEYKIKYETIFEEIKERIK